MTTLISCARKAKDLIVGLGILLFAMTLVLPYSSDYFSKEKQEFTKALNGAQSGKIQAATSLYVSPAENLSSKPFRLNQLTDAYCLGGADVKVGFALANAFNRLSRYRPASHVSPWVPSIVIAFRKLLI